MNRKNTILSIRNLSISFQTNSGELNAVRRVNLDLCKGETLAIVGESGSGKSVTVKSIMGMIPSNGRIKEGSIEFTYTDNGKSVTEDITKLTNKEMQKRIKGKRIAMIFQDPMTSLDPTMSIGNQIMEGVRYHYKISKKEAEKRAIDLLKMVGIKNAESIMKNYPHQLSGGMRQRVVIAIALSCEPDLLICDEPTTALDVTMQAKIIQLIMDIQQQKGISVLFITHDLGVVAKIADYVSIMYAGKIVEYGTVEDIFYDARHPYTWGLLSSTPDINNVQDRLYTIPGSPPNLKNKWEGDAFAERNQYAMNIDFRLEPPMFQINEHHYAATWLLHENAVKVESPHQKSKQTLSFEEEGNLANN
ncbi:ABC transporter ATP-binding protein [Niallia sp.]|uniref:ABC transporter ATP-binding protein n=1 Tax=Niallia sp. TaxID=2837523 RepID=UPI00289CAB92|nr:ABC transporter ATP-binding protein [Niallia sp.]